MALSVQDFSQHLNRDADFWIRSRKSVQGDLGVAAIHDGLYVFLFENGNELDVRDANTKPKVIIRSKSASLKPGKFENASIAY